MPVPSRTVPLHAQSVAFSAQEGGREQQAVRKHKRSTGLVHAAGHVVSGWEQCAHAQHVGKRGFRHQSASWHTCRANMFAEHLKLCMYNVPSWEQPHFLFQIRSHRRTSFPSSEHLSLVSALPILLPLGSATVADTDTDTDRVPSHTSRRDRRDDISVSVSVSVPSHHVQPVFLELRGGRNKIGMAIHLHKAEYFYYT